MPLGSDGSVENLDRVEELENALSFTFVRIPDYLRKREQYDDLRAVAVMDFDVAHVVVASASGIKTVSDLAAARDGVPRYRVYFGLPRSGTRETAREILTAAFDARQDALIANWEQRRIVAKVDELMKLCDELEAAQKEREQRRNRLATASLARLNQPADDVSEFREHARFHLRNLPRLVTKPEHVKQLRQMILNLAVRGKLVPRDPKDEPASALLMAIEREKARLVEKGELRKERPVDPIAQADVPFPIPDGWAWVRIGACALLVEYGTSVKSDADQGVPVLKMGDIQDGRLILGGQKKVARDIEDLPKLFLKRFDLLYNRTNSAELVGKTGIYLGADDAYTFASYNIRMRFTATPTLPRYVNLAMNAPYFRQTQIVPNLQQQCGQANVNGTKLRNMLVPLPPLAEQKRVIAKSDELMAICDQLDAQLAANEAGSQRLLEAVLHEALAPAA